MLFLQQLWEFVWFDSNAWASQSLRLFSISTFAEKVRLDMVGVPVNFNRYKFPWWQHADTKRE